LFGSTVTFGQGETKETNLSSAGSGDVFTARYNADGTLSWARRAGGTGGEYGYAVAVLSGDSAVVTGSFADTARFGPGEPGETDLTSAGSEDIFIARYYP